LNIEIATMNSSTPPPTCSEGTVMPKPASRYWPAIAVTAITMKLATAAVRAVRRRSSADWP